MKSEEHPARRILMTADAVGGVWQYSIDLIEALSSHGFETLLATMGPRPSACQKGQLSQIGNVQLAESDFKLEWMDNPWHDVDRSSEWLLSLERKFNPDVVHLNGYSLASAPFQAPVISVAHSCVYSWWAAVHKSEPGPGWLEYKHRVSRGLSASAAVVAPSRFMAEAASLYYGSRPEKTRVIHNFSNSPEGIRTKKEPFILAAGRMWDEAKNLRLLDSIAGKLQWPLYVAGDGQDRASSSDSIRHLGRLSHPDLLWEMGRAAIFAHPALYEPFGLAVLEAAKAGCCLVLADTPSLRELWDGAAVFVNARDEAAWTEELNKLIDNDPARQRLAEQALRHAERYRSESSVSAYLELYGSVRSKRHAGNGVAA